MDADDELEAVVGWRFKQLLLAGYTFEQAQALASTDVDLHQAVKLAAQCEPALAARILG